PFAYVMCIPQPAGAIDPKPLQKLVAALATEDIRRGYIVTAGRFNAAAREFADEKHLTLLPGDTFLDKLNALPATARTEIMQVISVGDYTVPSCPKCNARMVQPAENPAVWRCPDHPDQVIPAHK
ncbi:MAG: restriction endonuclease, partial [Opitutaceae bacterium]